MEFQCVVHGVVNDGVFQRESRFVGGIGGRTEQNAKHAAVDVSEVDSVVGGCFSQHYPAPLRRDAVVGLSVKHISQAIPSHHHRFSEFSFHVQRAMDNQRGVRREEEFRPCGECQYCPFFNHDAVTDLVGACGVQCHVFTDSQSIEIDDGLPSGFKYDLLHRPAFCGEGQFVADGVRVVQVFFRNVHHDVDEHAVFAVDFVCSSRLLRQRFSVNVHFER